MPEVLLFTDYSQKSELLLKQESWKRTDVFGNWSHVHPVVQKVDWFLKRFPIPTSQECIPCNSFVQENNLK